MNDHTIPAEQELQRYPEEMRTNLRYNQRLEAAQADRQASLEEALDREIRQARIDRWRLAAVISPLVALAIALFLPLIVRTVQ